MGMFISSMRRKSRPGSLAIGVIDFRESSTTSSQQQTAADKREYSDQSGGGLSGPEGGATEALPRRHPVEMVHGVRHVQTGQQYREAANYVQSAHSLLLWLRSVCWGIPADLG